MRTEKWWSIILTLGLFVALSPLSAQAGGRTFAPQPQRQAFTQPRAHINTFHRQPQQWHQPRPQAAALNRQPHAWHQPGGSAFGHHGQNRQFHQPYNHANAWHRQPQQHPGHAYGWNAQNRPWHQPRGPAYGWNGHNQQGHRPYGPAYGWNGHHRQGDHRNVNGRADHPRQWDYRNVNGRNDHQRWGDHRNVYGRNDQQRHWGEHRPDQQHQRQPQPNGGQLNPGSYNRAGYSAPPQSPTIAPPSSGYSHNPTSTAGHTGSRPSYRQPDATRNGISPVNQTGSGTRYHRDAPGTTPMTQGQSPSGAI